MIISSKLPIGDKRKVLILGNGFDLDLGRKTLYKDFYESDYCPKDYPAPLIRHLNEKWVDNLEAVKWYDLENELYNYYNELKSKEFKLDVFNNSETNETNVLFKLKDGNYGIIDTNNYGVSAVSGRSKYALVDFKRQPGSLIKPIFTYAPALEEKEVYLFNCKDNC